MDRLQKKCAIASTGVHALLLVIVLVGPAFLREEPVPDTLPVLEFVPLKTVDELVSGGGNPDAKPPPATFEKPPDPVEKQPPPPEQKPEVKPKLPDPEPEPVKPPPAKPKPAPDSLEVEKKPVENKPRLPEVSTKVVIRKNTASDATRKAAEEAKRRERELAETRRRLAERIGRMANNLSSDLSSSTTIELKGPGGGGVPYANWLQAVKSVYARAWTVPDGVTDEDATTVASVTIARDGTVINCRVTRSSGDSGVDRSVQTTLERVKFAAPLPDGARENDRTVSINFNVRARRQI